ncbi:MAG: potassium/hydrogen antiporter [Solirubrobacterales bacterium]|jgi:cell volume regulation protein A|nr:potassium/hydrogen antiporter [Solirubrobacterales bacterium]
MAVGQLVLVAGALLAAGLFASLLAVRMRVPSLVLFLGLGMAIGSDGTGWIHFNDYELARTIGIVALALILFEGGLTSGLLEIRPVLGAAVSLAVVGTFLTALITGLAAGLLFDLSVRESLLVGSIVAATDGAATFALLRGSTMNRRLAQTLEAESGLNDPVAVVLVLGFIDWIQKPGYGIGNFLALFGQELGIGLGIGVAIGWVSVQAFRRVRLSTVGLYPVASLAVAALAYGGADSLHGSGFLAVYLAGLALGSARVPARQTITTFHQGLAWVAQVALFLSLGLLVFPSQLGDVALRGTGLALALILVARPVSAYVATAFARFSPRERLVLGWAGLRGAVPVVLATFPVIAGVSEGLDFFNIVFFAVLLSTLLQGTTFEPFARRLGATSDEPALPITPVDVGTIRELGSEVLEFTIRRGEAAVGAHVRDLGLPREALVTAIIRGERAVAPRGATRVHEGDRLQVLVPSSQTRDVVALADGWRDGPVGPPPRPRLSVRTSPPVFSVRPWTDADGDASAPSEIAGQPVIERLRVRAERPGALVILADGHYALTGELLVTGSRDAVTQWARRRVLTAADDEDGVWLTGVIANLASDPGLPGA